MKTSKMDVTTPSPRTLRVFFSVARLQKQGREQDDGHSKRAYGLWKTRNPMEPMEPMEPPKDIQISKRASLPGTSNIYHDSFLAGHHFLGPALFQFGTLWRPIIHNCGLPITQRPWRQSQTATNKQAAFPIRNIFPMWADAPNYLLVDYNIHLGSIDETGLIPP